MTQLTQVGKVHTSVYTEDGFTRIRYHQTEVVKFSASEIILDSGGWQTFTTKNRMNQASNQYGLGYQVYQVDFVWYVDFKGETLEFVDGMTLTR